MNRTTAILSTCSLLCLAFFVFGITDYGQRVLIDHGLTKLSVNPSPMDYDDVYMGAGLAPWAWGLGGGIVLGAFGGLSFLVHRRSLRVSAPLR